MSIVPAKLFFQVENIIQVLSTQKINSVENISPSEECWKISTDSRSFQHGEVFIALNGEKFKGIDFVEGILPLKSPLIVVEMNQDNLQRVINWQKQFEQTTFLLVSDTLVYFQQLSHHHIKQWWQTNPQQRKIIGITGSNGKTTSKEMLTHFLKTLFPQEVWSTEKNFNNHIGVPKTLTSIHQGINIAIVEMGTNHVGEIPLLAKLGMPLAGIITCIGTAHIEFFYTQENILKEKGSLFYQVMENTNNQGYFVTDGDDPYLQKLPSRPHHFRIKEVKHQDFELLSEKNNPHHDPNYVYYTYQPHQVELFFQGKKFLLRNEDLTGQHNFKNLIMGFILAYQLYPHHEKALVAAASSFRPVLNRSCWIENEGKKYFMDAYNANPSSMTESLKGFVEKLQQEKVDLQKAYFILGDMNELGDYALKYHKEVGEFLSDLGVKNVAFIGRYGEFYQQGWKKDCVSVLDVKVFLDQSWPAIQAKYTYFFLKGSRSVQLEKLLDGGVLPTSAH